MGLYQRIWLLPRGPGSSPLGRIVRDHGHETDLPMRKAGRG